MAPIIPLIKRSEKVVDCFLKVKKDYLEFLNREKIFDKAIEGCLFIHPDTKNSNNQN